MGRVMVRAMVFVIGLSDCVLTCLNDLSNRGSLRAEDLTVWQKKTETMLLQIPNQTSLAPSLVLQAAGQVYIFR